MIEIQWNARAGQGAVTAAKILAECAILEGRYAQAMPEYGPERSGAPVKAYNRISPSPIRVHAHISSPDILIFLDAASATDPSRYENIRRNALVLCNSPLPEDALRRAAKLENPLILLDADRVSRERMGGRSSNLLMLAAACGAGDLVGLDALLQKIREGLGDKIKPGDAARHFQVLADVYSGAQKQTAAAEMGM